MSAEGYRTAIGLEVHVQLRTRTKMFCGCATAFGAAPNTQTCPVCLGYPGAMPAMNGDAVRLTVRTGLAIGATIPALSKFDRKSYFYPDMPKNYQITQYDQPLCEDGAVTIDAPDGPRAIRIRRIHLEEDVAKNTHFAQSSGVDFNRAGVPLMEIVTHPDMTSPDEAFAFLLALKQILQYAEVSDCNLEEGNIRCDVNVSVRPVAQAALGVKVELKNLNTFKGVLHALRHEEVRQAARLARGERMVQETRRWDADAGATTAMRTKEDAHDYRYFPEPDLMPVRMDPAQVAAWRAALPEPPRDRRARLAREFDLPDYDAGVLTADRQVADYFEATARLAGNGKAASNWMMTEMLRLLGETGGDLRALPLRPEGLAALIRMVEAGTVNQATAKTLFAELFERGGDPEALVNARGLGQVRDDDALAALVDQAMRDHARSVADYRAGKTAAAKFLIGQAMRLSRGQADPQRVARLLEDRLRAE